MEEGFGWGDFAKTSGGHACMDHIRGEDLLCVVPYAPKL